MTMMALTLWQPWATLMALDEKRIETRSWGTNYRGVLAIHAAKSMPAEARNLALCGTFARALARWEGPLPLGAVVTVVNLVDCFQITNRSFIAEPERSFGYYAAGRWAWVTQPLRRLARPIPARGAQGLWQWKEGDAILHLPLGEDGLGTDAGRDAQRPGVPGAGLGTARERLHGQ